jgi:hypothetical protein
MQLPHPHPQPQPNPPRFALGGSELCLRGVACHSAGGSWEPPVPTILPFPPPHSPISLTHSTHTHTHTLAGTTQLHPSPNTHTHTHSLTHTKKHAHSTPDTFPPTPRHIFPSSPHLKMWQPQIPTSFGLSPHHFYRSLPPTRTMVATGTGVLVPSVTRASDSPRVPLKYPNKMKALPR